MIRDNSKFLWSLRWWKWVWVSSWNQSNILVPIQVKFKSNPTQFLFKPTKNQSKTTLTPNQFIKLYSMFQVESFNSSTHHFAVKFALNVHLSNHKISFDFEKKYYRSRDVHDVHLVALPFFCTYASWLWSNPFNFKCARYGKIHLDDDDCLSCCNYTHAIKWVCIIQRYQERERACKAHNIK